MGLGTADGPQRVINNRLPIPPIIATLGGLVGDLAHHLHIVVRKS